MLWKRRLPLQEGQGLVEYALILSLVAIAVMIALTLFGDQVKTVYEDILIELGACASNADRTDYYVEYFVLVDKSSGHPGTIIQQIANGSTINISAYNPAKISIAPIAVPRDSGSMRLVGTTTGGDPINRIENEDLYDSWGNNGGNIGNGKVTLTATPFTGENGSGEQGCPRTISFSVTS